MAYKTAELQQFVNIYREHQYNISKTGQVVGLTRSTAQRMRDAAIIEGLLNSEERRPVGQTDRAQVQQDVFEPIEFETSPDIPIDELLRLRCEEFDRKEEAEKERKLIPVKIRQKGPIGLTIFGDPHVDDDGCDMPRLMRDVETVNSTPGMVAGNIGDVQNGWVGRLAHLWGEQSTSKRQAWQLTEWLITAVPWLFLTKGNHDLWSGTGDPLNWMKMSGGGVMDDWSTRLGLQFPNGREIRINARHDFPGHSMWNPAHAMSKAAMTGFRDHVLIAGHKHTSAYNIVMDPTNDMLSHCIRVGGYKLIDTYARVGGFLKHNFAPSCVIIIDPDAENETDLIQVFWSVQKGAEYLTHLRESRT